MTSRVPFIRPEFPSATDVANDFEAIALSNRFTNFGPFEQRLRSEIEDYVGQGTSAVTFANATIALMGVIKATMGSGDGRFVLVPSFTFAAGPAAIEWCGFRPLFIDVEVGGVQPSIDAAREALASRPGRVAGILFANAFGAGAAEIHAWETLAESADLPLVVDSAAGFGSTYKDGHRLGAAGHAEVFSLHATKPFGVGEGGVVLTTDTTLAARLMRFQNFGFGEDRRAIELGLNGKLQEISAAIGLRQLVGLEAAINRRQAIAAAYRDALTPLGASVPAEVTHSSVCFATVLMPNQASRDGALEALDAHGVESQHYYSAVHTHPHFGTAERHGPLPFTIDASSRVLSLPAHTDMAGEPLARTISVVAGVLTAG